MKQKRSHCLYCGSKIEAKTTRAVFCSTKCRVYWNREKEDKIEIEAKNKSILGNRIRFKTKTRASKLPPPPDETTKSKENQPETPQNGLKLMPKGLSIDQQIQWRIENGL